MREPAVRYRDEQLLLGRSVVLDRDHDSGVGDDTSPTGRTVCCTRHGFEVLRPVP